MRIAVFIKISLACLVVAFGLSFNGTAHFMFDNLSSFRVHFALAFLVCSIVFLAKRERRWLFVSAFGLLMNLVLIVPMFVPPEDVPNQADDITIRLLSSNVSPRNRNPEELVALVNREQPDIIGLIELTPGYLAGLEEMARSYPYRFEAPEVGFFGLAVYSKLPLSDAEIVYFGASVPPSIIAMLEIGGSEVELLLAHPYPPTSADLTDSRNLQLREIASYVRTSERPTIMLADLNTALWSPFYRQFIDQSGLINARHGFGVGGTWPPSRLLGVPIDHIFLSPEIAVNDFEVLPAMGSDHLPVAATVRLNIRRLASAYPAAVDNR